MLIEVSHHFLKATSHARNWSPLIDANRNKRSSVLQPIVIHYFGPHSVTERVERHVFVLLLRVKRRGLIILLAFILSTSWHHTSCITLFVMNLIRREVSIEVLSKWITSSRCRQESVYLSWR